MDELHRRVASRIREVAKAKKIPLSHVADRAAVSRTNVFDVLAGRKSPTLSFLKKVADALGVDTSELVPAPKSSKK